MGKEKLFKTLAKAAHAQGNLDEFFDLWKRDKDKAITMWSDLQRQKQRYDEIFSPPIIQPYQKQLPSKINLDETLKSPNNPEKVLGGLLTELMNRLDHLDDSMDFLFELLAEKGIIPPPPDENTNEDE